MGRRRPPSVSLSTIERMSLCEQTCTEQTVESDPPGPESWCLSAEYSLVALLSVEYSRNPFNWCGKYCFRSLSYVHLVPAVYEQLWRPEMDHPRRFAMWTACACWEGPFQIGHSSQTQKKALVTLFQLWREQGRVGRDDVECSPVPILRILSSLYPGSTTRLEGKWLQQDNYRF